MRNRELRQLVAAFDVESLANGRLVVHPMYRADVAAGLLTRMALAAHVKRTLNLNLGSTKKIKGDDHGV